MIYYKMMYNDKVAVIGKDNYLPMNAIEITEKEFNDLLSDMELYEYHVRHFVKEHLDNNMLLEDIPDIYVEDVLEEINTFSK